MSYEIINPESLGAPSGWNHGMLGPRGGRVLFVAGQTAPAAGPGFVDQWAAVLERVVRVVRAAGGGPTDIGRMTIYVTDLAGYKTNLKPIGEAYRRVMGKHFPAMALVEVTSLVDLGAVVEIEATVVIA